MSLTKGRCRSPGRPQQLKEHERDDEQAQHNFRLNTVHFKELEVVSGTRNEAPAGAQLLSPACKCWGMYAMGDKPRRGDTKIFPCLRFSVVQKEKEFT
jgi:hypothetical protein